jgi:hypothetical protein
MALTLDSIHRDIADDLVPAPPKVLQTRLGVAGWQGCRRDTSVAAAQTLLASG